MRNNYSPTIMKNIPCKQIFTGEQSRLLSKGTSNAGSREKGERV